MEKFSHALGFQSLDPSFRVSKQGPCFTAVEEVGGLWRLSFLALLIVLHRQILISLAIGITAFAEAILKRTSAEQISSLHMVAPKSQVLETGHLLQLPAVHANICTFDMMESKCGYTVLYSLPDGKLV